MSFEGFGVAIMAAGKGTRLKSKRPKVLHEVGGKALLQHVIRAAESVAPTEQIYCIVGHEAERVQAAVQNTGVRFIMQAQQLGTGHAVQEFKSSFQNTAQQPPEHLLVLSGDVPLIRPETLETLCKAHLRTGAAMTILTAIPPDPTGYGRVVRVSAGEPDVDAIVEQKSLLPGQLGSPEINSGIYCFRTSSLFAQLDHLSADNSQRELYLTDIAGLLRRSGERVVAVPADNVDEVLGANTIAEMMHLDAALRLATARRHMAAGVTIFRPDTCTIDADVAIAADTVIEPFVQLLGNTRIGANCRLRSYSVVQDSVLGDDVLLRHGSIVDRSSIGDGALIGPYAHLRPESEIGAAAHIGNFVETKKARIGRGSKANHLSYIGDAVIGTGSNIGAGVITCNYDGVSKRLTEIGDGVFVGSDATLVAPVKLENGSYVAAGSCVTENVPADALALGRARQVTKEGWALQRREAQARLKESR